MGRIRERSSGRDPSTCDGELRRLLDGLSPLAVESYDWSSARWDPLEVEIGYYPTERWPPLELMTSVRAVVLRGEQVLVVTDPEDEPYVCPGGHRDPGETLEETVRRELVEETGWRVGGLRRLGFMLITTTSPRPEAFPYPFPHAAWPIYLTDARRYDARGHTGDPGVRSAGFVSLARARRLPMNRLQRALLEHALRVRGAVST